MKKIRKMKENYLRWRNRKGSWTFDDIRYVLIGKRFTQRLPQASYIPIHDFIITGVEPDEKYDTFCHVFHKDGEYKIDTNALVSLAQRGWFHILGSGNYCIAAYKVEEVK